MTEIFDEQDDDFAAYEDPELDEDLSELFKEAIRLDQEMCRIKKLPICKYDYEKDAAYLEYPDGRREYE